MLIRALQVRRLLHDVLLELEGGAMIRYTVRAVCLLGRALPRVLNRRLL